MEGLNSEDDEDWLRLTPKSVALVEETPKKRPKKVITLDDILEADHRESARKQKPSSKPKNKRLQKSKLKSHLYSSSDDDSEEDLRAPHEMLDELEKQVASGAGEEVEPEWGLPVLVFAQRETPSLVCRLVP